MILFIRWLIGHGEEICEEVRECLLEIRRSVLDSTHLQKYQLNHHLRTGSDTSDTFIHFVFIYLNSQVAELLQEREWLLSSLS